MLKKLPPLPLADASGELVQLLREGACIELTSRGVPRYCWAETPQATLPEADAALDNSATLRPTTEAAQLLVRRVSKKIFRKLRRSPPSYVTVFDNGGMSLMFAQQFVARLQLRYCQPIGLLVVRRARRRLGDGSGHGKIRWRMWYQESLAHPLERLRPIEKDLGRIRNRRTFMWTMVLEQDSYVIDIATAFHRDNGIEVLCIASLVSRDHGIKSFVGEKVEHDVPLFHLYDANQLPRWQSSGDKNPQESLPLASPFELPRQVTDRVRRLIAHLRLKRLPTAAS